MKIRTIAVCALLTLTAVPAAHADPGIVVNDVVHAGSGCPAGSVAVNAAPDWKTLTLEFDKFVVSTGPGISITESRKHCNVKIILRLPQKAMHVAVRTVDYQGFVNLDNKVAAMLTSAIYTPRTVEQKTDVVASWEGPLSEDYSFTGDIAQPVFSANPGDTVSLMIDSIARVDNSRDKKAQGILTTDTITHKTRIVLGLQWRG